MIAYILRRSGLFVLGLLVTSLVIFFMLRILPGDVAQIIGGIKASPEQVEQIRSAYGLDQPLWLQYCQWLRDLIHLDLGNSLATKTSIAAELQQKLAVTIPLCVLALVMSSVIGVVLGIVAALRHRRASGVVVNAFAQALAAVPVVWVGLLLVIGFGRGLGFIEWFPSQGFPREQWESPGRALLALVLPAVTITIVESAIILRYVRSAVLEVIPQDFVRAAAARGLTKTQAIIRRGLPNASLTILSVIALQAAALVTGAVIIEALFGLPGIGSMLLSDVGNRDLIKVQTTVLLLTGLVLLIGLVVDVLHRVIDPRVRRRQI